MLVFDSCSQNNFLSNTLQRSHKILVCKLFFLLHEEAGLKVNSSGTSKSEVVWLHSCVCNPNSQLLKWGNLGVKRKSLCVYLELEELESCQCGEHFKPLHFRFYLLVGWFILCYSCWVTNHTHCRQIGHFFVRQEELTSVSKEPFLTGGTEIVWKYWSSWYCGEIKMCCTGTWYLCASLQWASFCSIKATYFLLEVQYHKIMT